MSSAPKTKAVQQIALPPMRESVSVCVEECLQKTATALFQNGKADKEELIQAMNQVRRSHAEGNPADLIDTLARSRTPDESQLAITVLALSEAVSSTMTPIILTVPFVGKYIAPSAFYERFPQLRKLGKALMAPVTYAEDADAIGTGSINPIAAVILGEEIAAVLAREMNVHPLISSVLLDHAGWLHMVRKHYQR